jgi:hypothetical protein
MFITSFKLTQEGDLKTPYIQRISFSAFTHILIFTSIVMIIYKLNSTIGFGLLFFSLLIVLPLAYLFHIQKRAQISWLAYASITNKPATMAEANTRIANIAWSLRILAIIEYVIANRGNESNENGGVWELVKKIFIGLIVTVIDVAENYLLPTMVIEQKSIKDAIPDLIEMKENIPASLAGAFGFDLIGDAISSFSSIIYLGIILAGAALTFFLGKIVPVSLQTTIASWHLFLLPFIFSVFTCSFIGSFIKISATSLKAIYFSIFYTSINRPHEIVEKYQDQITNYLNHQDSSLVGSIKTDLQNILPHTLGKKIETHHEHQPSHELPKQTMKSIVHAPKESDQNLPKTVSSNEHSTPDAENPTHEKAVHIKPETMELAHKYVFQMRNKGASDQELTTFFLKKGWPSSVIKILLTKEEKSA